MATLVCSSKLMRYTGVFYQTGIFHSFRVEKGKKDIKSLRVEKKDMKSLRVEKKAIKSFRVEKKDKKGLRVETNIYKVTQSGKKR